MTDFDVLNETRFHMLPTEEFNAVARGFGDAKTMQSLREALYNKWLMTLGAIVDIVRDEQCVNALALLDQARVRSPAKVEQLATYPYVQYWAPACLDQAIGIATGDAVAVHLDYLSAFSAVAAFQTGVESFSIESHVRDGRVMLPTLGCAVFPNASEGDEVTIACGDGHLAVVCKETTVVIPSETTVDAPGWLGVRTLTAEYGDDVITVALDDLDPYRSYDTSWLIGAERVSQSAFKQWEDSFGDAWDYLCEHHADYVPSLQSGLRVITPSAEARYPAVQKLPHGFGGLTATRREGLWLAYLLLDGFQRSKLSALHQVIPLHHGLEAEQHYFAPWFSVGGISLTGVLEGLYATPSWVEFWQARCEMAVDVRSRAEAELECALRQTWFIDARLTLLKSGELDGWGERMLAQVTSRMDEFARDDISPVVWQEARNITLDRRVSWRLRNLMPEQSALATLAEAWISGATCPVTSVRSRYEPREYLDGHIGRKQLVTAAYANSLRVLNEGQLDDAEPTEMEVTNADILAIAGNTDAAIQAYELAIANDPYDSEPWAGLIAVLHRGGRVDLASIVLHNAPEVVYQLHRMVAFQWGASVSPRVLAAWLSPLILTSTRPT